MYSPAHGMYCKIAKALVTIATVEQLYTRYPSAPKLWYAHGTRESMTHIARKRNHDARHGERQRGEHHVSVCEKEEDRAGQPPVPEQLHLRVEGDQVFVNEERCTSSINHQLLGTYRYGAREAHRIQRYHID